jgi:hypothetical protein
MSMRAAGPKELIMGVLDNFGFEIFEVLSNRRHHDHQQHYKERSSSIITIVLIPDKRHLYLQSPPYKHNRSSGVAAQLQGV